VKGRSYAFKEALRKNKPPKMDVRKGRKGMSLRGRNELKD
jgi:hypothetical protein